MIPAKGFRHQRPRRASIRAQDGISDDLDPAPSNPNSLFAQLDREVPRSIAWAFDIIGVTLLFNILGVAVAPMPSIAAYGPDALNLWVGAFPFIWLPTVFVCFALFGHVVLTRRLLQARNPEDRIILTCPRFDLSGKQSSDNDNLR